MSLTSTINKDNDDLDNSKNLKEWKKRENETMWKVYDNLCKEKNMLLLKLRRHPNKEIQDNYNELVELKKEVYTENDKTNSPLFYWITMRPPPSVDYETFLKVVRAIHSKKWMTDYLYVIEQSGKYKDELGKGFHLHSLVKRNDKKNHELRKEIKNTCKSIGDIENQGFLDIAGIYDPETLKNKFNYIINNKKNDEYNDKNKKLEKYYYQGKFFLNIIEKDKDKNCP